MVVRSFHENLVENPQGRAALLLVCDHASNLIPASHGTLGLDPIQREDHIAWDIGARALARELAVLLDAPLVCAQASRLLVDPNRALDAADLIPAEVDGNPVPGNIRLDADDRQARIDAFHLPYHAAIDAALAARPWITGLVAIHSFTPRLNGLDRPWHVGILHGADARMANRLIAALSAHRGIEVGRNQPYAPVDGVYYTLDRHAAGRETAMIEVRNDQLRDEIGQRRWAGLLANALRATITA